MVCAKAIEMSRKLGLWRIESTSYPGIWGSTMDTRIQVMIVADSSATDWWFDAGARWIPRSCPGHLQGCPTAYSGLVRYCLTALGWDVSSRSPRSQCEARPTCILNLTCGERGVVGAQDHNSEFGLLVLQLTDCPTCGKRSWFRLLLVNRPVMKWE